MALDLGIFLEGAESSFKVKVSSNDTQPNYLINKLTSSDASVTITETNDGGVEQIDLTASSSSPLTTKGDLYTFDSSDARLAVGTDGQALVADSTQPTGLKWDTVSADNFANADLTLDANRFHELDSNNLNLLGDETGVFKVKNSTLHGVNPTADNGISFYQKSNGLNYIKGSLAGMYIGSSTFDNLFLFGTGQSKFQNDLQVGGIGYIGGTGARLKVRGSNMSAGAYTVLFENSGGLEGFRVENDRQTYTKRLNVTGLGSTSATTTLLVQNSSGTNLFKVDDSGGFALGSGAIYTNDSNVSIGKTAEATGDSSISIGVLSDAKGTYDIAIGRNSSAEFGYGVAIGQGATIIAGNYGVAIGSGAASQNLGGIAVGVNTDATVYALALGYVSQATGDSSTAIGRQANSSGAYSTSIGGRQTKVTVSNSIFLSASSTTKTLATANVFAVNLNNANNVLQIGQTTDSYYSGTGSFGFGTTTPDASASVDITSTTKGFLPPRMTTTEKNAISTPATGLVVYDSTLNKLCVYTGAAWETITSL